MYSRFWMLLKLKSIMIYPELQQVIKDVNPARISIERKEVLQPLINYIQQKKNNQEKINLNFICTHNSRRSHLSQIWAQTMATQFNINNVFCYSGGTEATALFPFIAITLENSGFHIQTLTNNTNPIYSIKFGSESHPIIGFSKTYDDDFNPENSFAAIMTCSSADQGCPFIPGAEKRIPVTYEDPKLFDKTAEQETKYHERSMQIATEMYYVFSQIN